MKLRLSIFVAAFLVEGHTAPVSQNLQTPPAVIQGNYPKLSPLLETDLGKSISTKREWEKRRAEYKTEWLKFLGDLPAKKAELKTEILATEQLSGFTRQLVRYQIEEGVFTDGYLLTPKKGKGKLPAIVVFHPTTPLQAQGVAGLSKDYAEEKWQGVQLAERGYIVWCPRNYINTDGFDWVGNTKNVITKHPTWTGMTRMVWDAIRAADFVESLPNVDKKRIGCIGHSLGGKQAFYAVAFDDRYKAAVSSEGGIGLKFSNWEAVWYLGARIKQADFKLENHQVLSFVAPRAFLLLAGESADSDKSWAFIEAVMPIYKIYGKPENLGWFNHRMGHRYPPEARTVAEEFLDQHLRK